MQRLEVSGVVRPIYGSLGVKGLNMLQVKIYFTSVLDCGVTEIVKFHCKFLVT